MINAKDLPVYTQRAKILEALQEHPVIVVESPTGSGKTTQLPVILHEAGYSQRGMIGVTQPRRIAAVSVSAFIGRQLEPEVPGFVAYKMRFEDRTDRNTKIKVMTDGILLQELKADPMLSAYSVIMVDEAHERSLNIDFILGLLKRILELRQDFKVIVSSATINAEVFSQYFSGCPVVRIETETYPVQTIYAPPAAEKDPDALKEKIVDLVEHVLEEERKGDILIFLSGEKLIKDTISKLYSMPWARKLHIIPLYGRLSKEEQDLVFPPPPKDKVKVVVSTNIAETSITIDGISTVIDSGLAKINFYSPKTYTSSLVEMQISKASANQRRGRAGRTRPGTCYRLYSKDDFESRPLFTMEEIYRTDLSEVVLRMSELGIRDFTSFDFISSPGKQGIAAAVDTLLLLDALTPENELSQTGKYMAEFPLLPRHSRILVEGMIRYPDVLDELLIAVSFLTTDSPYLLPQGEEMEARRAHHRFREQAGDFLSYLKLYRSYQDSTNKERFCQTSYLDQQTMDEILNIKDQLSQIVSSIGLPIGSGGSTKDFLCAIARGLIQFICVRTGRNYYRSLTAEAVEIHPGSVMFREDPDFIVAGEIVRTSRTFARSVSPLKREWLEDVSPELARALLPAARSQKSSGQYREGQRTSQKDSTWQVYLGGKIYPLTRVKGNKKLLEISYEECRRLMKNPNFSPTPHSLNLRVVLLHGRYRLLEGERLSSLFGILRYLNPDRDLLPPGARSSKFHTGGPELAKGIDLVGKLVPMKKKDRSLGFLTLYSNGTGSYWFKVSASIIAMVSESLASLEAMADDPALNIDQKVQERINRKYRWLSGLLEAL